MSEKQKKIWITGASSGIGKSVAEKFANEGWKVAVSARRKELLEIQKSSSKFGPIHHTMRLMNRRSKYLYQMWHYLQ